MKKQCLQRWIAQGVGTLAILLFAGYYAAHLPAASAGFADWSGLKGTADTLGYNLEGETDPFVVVGRGIRYTFSLLGIIFLILILIGYMKISGAGGNDEQVTTGKKWIKNGAWGVVILMAAYLVTMMVLGLASGGGLIFQL